MNFLSRRNLQELALFCMAVFALAACAPLQELPVSPTPAAAPTLAEVTVTLALTPDTPHLTPSSTPTPEATATPEAPVQETITFELNGGGTLEMLKFNTPEEALAYVAKETLWRSDDRFTAQNTWLKTPDAYEFFVDIKKIPGWIPRLGISLPEKKNSFFTLSVDQVGNGTLLMFQNNKGVFESVFIAVPFDEFNNYRLQYGDAIPTPIQ
jgi:hypothetical protein